MLNAAVKSGKIVLQLGVLMRKSLFIVELGRRDENFYICEGKKVRTRIRQTIFAENCSLLIKTLKILFSSWSNQTPLGESLTKIWNGDKTTRWSSSYLLHLAALPLAGRARDLDGDGALLPLPPQRHAVGLQRAEGDLQLRPREAAGPPVLCGNLRRLEDRREAGGALCVRVENRLLVEQNAERRRVEPQDQVLLTRLLADALVSLLPGFDVSQLGFSAGTKFF